MFNLLTETGVIRDDGARTLSYFCTEENVRVGNSVIEQLLQVSANNGDCDVRLCLHPSPEESFHQMIILQHGLRPYHRPHKHASKPESCTIIKGKLGFFVFNDNGHVISSHELEEGRDTIVRIGDDQWHTIIPISPYAIYQESKPGPYLGVSDSIFPLWAPEDESSPEALDYARNTLRILTHA